MTYLFASALGLGVIAIIAWCLIALGSARWSRATASLTQKLESARTDTRAPKLSPERFDPREIEGLPPVVQRYFRAALKDGQPIVSAAVFEMCGNMNLSAAGERWKSFKSRQRVVTRRAGFVWDAKVRMFSGLTVRVVDSYVAGAGLMQASILGLFTVAKVDGDVELGRGELMRFFAEAPWYPTALLPSQGVRWAAVDAQSANATLVDGPYILTLLFRFNEADLIDSVRSEARGASFNGKMVMMPWECRLSAYEVRGGMAIPTVGEAAWMPPEGRRTYFRGLLTSVEYE